MARGQRFDRNAIADAFHQHDRARLEAERRRLGCGQRPAAAAAARGLRIGSAKSLLSAHRRMFTAPRRERHAQSESLRVSEPLVIPRGRGEIVGDTPDRRVEILCEDETLHATWSRFGPRRDGADLHVHHHHTDLFYVLDGELTVRLGTADDTVALPAGALARVPALVVHGFRNDSDAPVRFLNFHAPGRRFAEFLRALRDGRTFAWDQHPPPADGGRPTSEAVISGSGRDDDGRPGWTTVLADVEEIGIAEVLADGHAAPREHLHRHHLESLYVLEGELTVAVATGELLAEAGSWVRVPRGVVHTLRAASGPVRFLHVHTPSSGLGALDEVPA